MNNRELTALTIVVLAIAGVLVAIIFGVTQHSMNGQQVTREQAKACIEAKKSWVQNTNSNYECR